MTIVCRNVPNRTEKRPFKANDVGRIFCLALEQGESRQKIINAINKKCKKGDICDKQKVRQQLTVALGILAALAVAVYIPLSAALAFLATALLIAARLAPILLRIGSLRRALDLLRSLPKTKLELDKAIQLLENIAR